MRVLSAATMAGCMLASSLAHAELVGYDPAYLRQLQDSGTFVMVEFTSYR
jgi:hypothetical protein